MSKETRPRDRHKRWSNAEDGYEERVNNLSGFIDFFLKMTGLEFSSRWPVSLAMMKKTKDQL